MRELSSIHCPVMLSELLSQLDIKSDGIYVDMTLGAGGHGRAVLEKLDTCGYLIGVDRDEQILAYAERVLKPVERKYSLHHNRYSNIADILEQLNIAQIDGVIMDLGVSSLQLDDETRGFSFLREGPLDMRMGKDCRFSAASIINTFSESQLISLFREYGEEPKTIRIVRAIVKSRQVRAIKSTLELANIVARATNYTRGRIHPATRVFQALRIAVNDELHELEMGLNNVLPYLKVGGRIVVISFHSLEDRIVKHFFRDHQDILEIITKKPIIPTSEEFARNPRSRSAKLRCASRRNYVEISK